MFFRKTWKEKETIKGYVFHEKEEEELQTKGKLEKRKQLTKERRKEGRKKTQLSIKKTIEKKMREKNLPKNFQKISKNNENTKGLF